MKEEIKHLLIPKEFRVWCLPNRPIGDKMLFTTKPSEANCANCLTKFRAKTTGQTHLFKKRHTFGRQSYYDQFPKREPIPMRDEIEERIAKHNHYETEI